MKKLIILFFCLQLIACTGKEIEQEVEKNDEIKTDNVSNSEEMDKNEIIDTHASYTFSEDRRFLNEDFELPSDILSLEAVADLVNSYINRVWDSPGYEFHFSLDYNYNYNIDVHTWYANIYISQDDFEKDKNNEFPMYAIGEVLLDAQSGEIIQYSYHNVEPLKGITFEKARELSHPELLELFPAPDESEINEVLEHAQSYVSLHYPYSNIKELYYGSPGPDGNPFTDYHPSAVLDFFALLEDGTYVEGIVQRETYILVNLHIYNEELRKKFNSFN